MGETSVEERAKFCSRIAEGLQARMDEIATLVSQEVGMVKPLSLAVQAGLPLNSFNVGRPARRVLPFEEKMGNSLIVREPVGVVGCITPWNYPLHQIAAKVAYALAAGCTVVLKPSEVAPLNAYVLAEVVDEIGLPAGVFNMVSGVGPVVGEAIAAHPDVDMVSFTGSTRAGRRVGGAVRRPHRQGRPGAGRQERQRHPARRRPRKGGGRRRRQGLLQLGSDLLGPHPDAGAAPPAGRGRGDRGPDGRAR